MLEKHQAVWPALKGKKFSSFKIQKDHGITSNAEDIFWLKCSSNKD